MIRNPFNYQLMLEFIKQGELIDGDRRQGVVYLSTLIDKYKPKIVVHLASLAGVRNSINNVIEYANNNIISQINLLEQCRKNNVEIYNQVV